jgi:hypothetical protein
MEICFLNGAINSSADEPITATKLRELMSDDMIELAN